jgi:hypothetical protein
VQDEYSAPPRQTTLERLPPYQAALDAAARGWPVFPVHSIVAGHCTCGSPACSSPGKHPIIAGGVTAATTDPAQIELWWSRWPWANVGIATGPVAGFWVLDEDPRHGGDRSLALLKRAYGPLPPTVTCLTSGGGRHYYFHWQNGVPNNNTGALAPGLDLKSAGGYVLGRGSLHLYGTYDWHPEGHPDEVAIAWAPSWLMARVLALPAQRQVSVIPQGNAKRLLALLREPCSDGTRNATCATLADYFAFHRVNCLATLALLQLWNTACCQPPLAPVEVQATVQSMYRYRARRGRAVRAVTRRRAEESSNAQ